MRDLDHAAAIYRITRKGDNPRPAKYDINTEAGQIASLKSPANNVRDAGFTRLKAAGEKSLPAVKALLDDPNEYIQARAVWLLAQLGDKGIAEVEKVLADDNPQMRIAAFRALRFVDHKLLEHAEHSPRIRPSPCAVRSLLPCAIFPSKTPRTSS